MYFPAKACFFLRIVYLTEWLKKSVNSSAVPLLAAASQSANYICLYTEECNSRHARRALSLRGVLLSWHFFTGLPLTFGYNVWLSCVGDFRIWIPSPCRETEKCKTNHHVGIDICLPVYWNVFCTYTHMIRQLRCGRLRPGIFKLFECFPWFAELVCSELAYFEYAESIF